MSKPHAKHFDTKKYGNNFDDIDWGPKVAPDPNAPKKPKRVRMPWTGRQCWSEVYSGLTKKQQNYRPKKKQ
jgi:hypothetical protein